MSYPHDPSLSCPYPPGDALKVACLIARRERGLSLWVEGDKQGARKWSDAQPSAVTRHSQIERRIIQAIGIKELPAKALAARTGEVLEHRFYTALTLLAQAGVLEHNRKGWKLAALEV